MSLVGGPAGSTTCRPRTAAEIAGGVPGFPCLSRSFVTNTPGKIKGGEIEVEAHPILHLSINFSGGYSRFTAPDLEIPTRATDRVLGILDWTGSAGIT